MDVMERIREQVESNPVILYTEGHATNADVWFFQPHG